MDFMECILIHLYNFAIRRIRTHLRVIIIRRAHSQVYYRVNMSDQIDHTVDVPFDEGNKRLDQVAAKLFPDYSRSVSALQLAFLLAVGAGAYA